uniref:transporter substrate-binding domain-containing protein n=1 Tax=Aliarcobacter sp. TaxID=2321116 RepID=UPI0040472B4D
MKTLIILFLLNFSIFAKPVDFKVSYDPNYAPFSYEQEGKATGLLIDVWKLWAKYNNYTIEFVNGKTWENSISLVKDKKVDFFVGTEKYDDWMFNSRYFYELKSSFFTLSKNPATDIKDYSTIGIIGNDLKNIIIKNYPNTKLKYYEDYKDLIADLKKGNVDFIYDDKLAIEFYSIKNNFFHLIKPLNVLSLKNKVQAISYEKEKVNIFDEGFIKVPINELLELEQRWIINEKEQYYPDFSQQIILTDKEIEFLKNTTIKASISKGWEPFTFKSKNNQAIGISSEYWKLIINRLNLKNEDIFYETFSEQLESIKNKEADLIFSVGKTPQREEYSIFSKEYGEFPISIVTNKDQNFIEDISFLMDKKIAVGNNFTAHQILKNNFPDMNFILVNSVKEGLELVSKNKVYAFIDIKPVLLYNIAKHNFTDLKISGKTGLNFNIRFMIRDDHEILQSILNKAISSISINELETIIKKWDNVQFQTNINYDLFWQIGSFVFLLLLAFIYRNFTLKNLNQTLKIKVEEKTKKLNQMNKNLENLVERKTKELIQKENILNQQSKMAAMGEMIENIAHQWRQPLSVISTVATGTKLKKDLGILSDEEFYETMEIINKSSQHLSSTIDDFRNFFSDEKEIVSFNINIPIEKVLYLISSKLKNRNITVIKKSEEIYVEGLENEFLQVILNIINNAMDALEDKKDIDKYIFINIYKEGEYIILKIKDNAGGIEDEIINRVFEPYFTTKHKSQGTGIGLYMSLEIIKKHMLGVLSVSNKIFTYNNIKYKGAEFLIKLPLNEN